MSGGGRGASATSSAAHGGRGGDRDRSTPAREPLRHARVLDDRIHDTRVATFSARSEAHSRRSATGVRFGVRSYGSSIWSGFPTSRSVRRAISSGNGRFASCSTSSAAAASSPTMSGRVASVCASLTNLRRWRGRMVRRYTLTIGKGEYGSSDERQHDRIAPRKDSTAAPSYCARVRSFVRLFVCSFVCSRAARAKRRRRRGRWAR